jgi:hypothetical protein
MKPRRNPLFERCIGQQIAGHLVDRELVKRLIAIEGVQNGGRCEGSNCDTHAYVQEVNKQGLCGANDWRMPSRKELLSIVDNGQYKPAIDTGFFPNTSGTHFWSSSPYADQANLAWQVNFQYGEALTAEKGQGSQVRLVRREK